MDEVEKQCHIDCLEKYKSVVQCAGYCKKCVIDLACWSDTADYGGTADLYCEQNCRGGTCKVMLGSDKALCSCETHGF